MRSTPLFVALLLGLFVSPAFSSETSKAQLTWQGNYRDAVLQARREKKMMFILFCAEGDASQCDCLCKDVLTDAKIIAKLKKFVCLRVPLDATTSHGKKQKKLLEHSSLAEMLGRQGMAVIDYAHKDADYYGTVVSCFPILRNQPYSVKKTLVILNLPPGTLHQRTLIYAVRIHPECPASTNGRLSPILVEEAQSHSRYQARIRLQGHHNWENRFHRINTRLSNGLIACEVCAESWPGEGLLQGAIECVRCWRLSSGHWSAVRGYHNCYGYDIERGSNGIWYATGIFGTRH